MTKMFLEKESNLHASFLIHQKKFHIHFPGAFHIATTNFHLRMRYAQPSSVGKVQTLDIVKTSKLTVSEDVKHPKPEPLLRLYLSARCRETLFKGTMERVLVGF